MRKYGVYFIVKVIWRNITMIRGIILILFLQLHFWISYFPFENVNKIDECNNLFLPVFFCPLKFVCVVLCVVSYSENTVHMHVWRVWVGVNKYTCM